MAVAWEYVRNDAFDANTFFANLNGTAQTGTPLQHVWFNFGGPVPKIGHEKKTFFFYNMEWRRLVNGSEINAVSVPAAARTGDFSYSCRHGARPVVQLKVPQTTDPAQIAKLAQFGLTPGRDHSRTT